MTDRSDQRLETIVGLILRFGVLAAAAVVACGGVLYLMRHGGESFDLRTFHGEPADLTSVLGILRAAFDLRARGIIQLGLLILIATPVARVAFSVLGFGWQKDRLYVVLTLVVLGFLLLSFSGFVV